MAEQPVYLTLPQRIADQYRYDVPVAAKLHGRQLAGHMARHPRDAVGAVSRHTRAAVDGAILGAAQRIRRANNGVHDRMDQFGRVYLPTLSDTGDNGRRVHDTVEGVTLVDRYNRLNDRVEDAVVRPFQRRLGLPVSPRRIK